MADVHGRRAIATTWCCGPAPASTSCTIRCATARCSTSSRCSAPRRTPRRGDREPHRAELDARYRDSHPTMKALLAMIDLARALGSRRPRSGPALAQGPRRRSSAMPRIRRCNRWRRAPAWRSRMGLPRRIDRRERRRFRAPRSGDTSARGYLRTARVQFESRYHCGQFYHADGIAREVAMRPWRADERSRRCLAWLYDGARCRLPSASALTIVGLLGSAN